MLYLCNVPLKTTNNMERKNNECYVSIEVAKKLKEVGLK